MNVTAPYCEQCNNSVLCNEFAVGVRGVVKEWEK